MVSYYCVVLQKAAALLLTYIFIFESFVERNNIVFFPRVAHILIIRCSELIVDFNTDLETQILLSTIVICSFLVVLCYSMLPRPPLFFRLSHPQESYSDQAGGG